MRLLAILAVCAVIGAAGCGRSTPTTKLYFLDGQMTSLGWRGQLAAVERSGLDRPADVLRALLRGPPLDEIRRGFVTTIPRGTRLGSLEVSRGTALVDLTGGLDSSGLPGTDFEGAGQIAQRARGHETAHSPHLQRLGRRAVRVPPDAGAVVLGFHYVGARHASPAGPM